MALSGVRRQEFERQEVKHVIGNEYETVRFKNRFRLLAREELAESSSDTAGS